MEESDFIRVLEMKGLKRAEQQPLLDAFHAVQGSQGKEGGAVASTTGIKSTRMSASSLAGTAGVNQERREGGEVETSVFFLG